MPVERTVQDVLNNNLVELADNVLASCGNPQLIRLLCFEQSSHNVNRATTDSSVGTFGSRSEG